MDASARPPAGPVPHTGPDTSFSSIPNQVFFSPPPIFLISRGKMAGGQSYINIQMSESSTNGIPSSKLSPDPADQGGSTLTFHNISYSVKVKSGFLCCRKTASKEVLRDLK